jgi:uncharacterized tellurite resistance protein B-like protein
MPAMERALQNIIAFAMADGDFADEERDYLDALRRQMGIDDETYQRLLHETAEGAKSLKIPKEPEEVRELIHRLVQAAASDHDVSSTERKLLARIAEHAGVSLEEVDRLIEQELEAVGNDTLIQPDPAVDAAMERLTATIYKEFNAWDQAMRETRLAEMAQAGVHAVIPLLRLLESYRVPDGAVNALDLKTLVVNQLGGLKDERAVYYLIQQVNIGDSDDEISCLSLRAAAAAAVGQILGRAEFTADQTGINALRRWWLHSPTDRQDFDKLAM